MDHQEVYIVRQLESTSMMTISIKHTKGSLSTNAPYENYHSNIKQYRLQVTFVQNRQAARTLEKQSETPYFIPQLEILEAHLDKNEQLGVDEQTLIGQLIKDKDSMTQDRIRLIFLELMLAQTAKTINKGNTCGEEIDGDSPKCLKPLIKSRDQKMLQKMQSYTDTPMHQEEARNRLNDMVCQLIFEPERFLQVDNKSLLRRIVDLSDTSGIEKHTMERIIKLYVDNSFGRSKGNASRSSDFYDLCNFSLMEQNYPSTSELPKRLIATLQHETKYEIVQLQLNRACTKIITIGVNIGQKQSQICLWFIDKFKPSDYNGRDRYSPAQSFFYVSTDTLKQLVTCVTWNHELQQNEQLIATASRSSLTIFNGMLKRLVNLDEIDSLCCRFNPITNFLYSGGLNNHQLRVWDSKGEQLDTYRTGPVRDIIFSTEGTRMYLISSTNYNIVRMDTVNAEKLAEASFTSPIFDCVPTNNDSELLVCSKGRLFVLKESNLQIVRSFELESSQDNPPYYSYVRCWGPWYIVSGEKYFRAIYNHTKGKMVHWNHKYMFPAFDCTTGTKDKVCLVSSRGKKISIWTGGIETIIIDDELSNKGHEQNSRRQLQSEDQISMIGDEVISYASDLP